MPHWFSSHCWFWCVSFCVLSILHLIIAYVSVATINCVSNGHLRAGFSWHKLSINFWGKGLHAKHKSCEVAEPIYVLNDGVLHVTLLWQLEWLSLQCPVLPVSDSFAALKILLLVQVSKGLDDRLCIQVDCCRNSFMVCCHCDPCGWCGFPIGTSECLQALLDQPRPQCSASERW